MGQVMDRVKVRDSNDSRWDGDSGKVSVTLTSPSHTFAKSHGRYIPLGPAVQTLPELQRARAGHSACLQCPTAQAVKEGNGHPVAPFRHVDQ